MGIIFIFWEINLLTGRLSSPKPRLYAKFRSPSVNFIVRRFRPDVVLAMDMSIPFDMDQKENTGLNSRNFRYLLILQIFLRFVWIVVISSALNFQVTRGSKNWCSRWSFFLALHGYNLYNFYCLCAFNFMLVLNCNCIIKLKRISDWRLIT